MIPPIQQDTDGGDYGEGMRERMYLLAAGMSAPTIVEIGTRSGNSARIWSTAVAENGGHVFTIDCNLYLNQYASVWSMPHVTLVIGSSQHLAPKWDKPIDLLYIDGDHTAKGLREDLQGYWPHLKVGGHLLVHDITNAGHYVDLIPVFNGFCRAHSLAWEVWPNHCGMAHVVKAGT